MKKTAKKRHAALIFVVALVAAGCQPLDTIRTAILPATPHERYLNSLKQAGLDDSALGRLWIEASEAVLNDALHVSLPFRESGFFGREEAAAVGYRFSARRGEQIVVEVTGGYAGQARLFADLFEAPDDTARSPRRAASMEDDGQPFHHTSRGGTYLLRIQPELLQDAAYSVTVRTAASLAFPVEGVDSRAIRSVFGDSRDGGRRRHEGVDIFAPRGTPVLAAAPGIATARENRLGGKVIWLRAPLGGHSFYYAHLDSQIVGSGTRVSTGDTLGLVGNTGNARYTPPHLHFGIYVRGRGAVDPFPFIDTIRREPAAVAVDVDFFGRKGRISVANANIRRGPAVNYDAIDLLPRHTAVRIRGGHVNWYRVEMPDGRTGFIAGNLVETMEQPVARRPATEGSLLLAGPSITAAVKDTLRAGQQLAVFGQFGGFQFVQAESGRTGWAPL